MAFLMGNWDYFTPISGATTILATGRGAHLERLGVFYPMSKVFRFLFFGGVKIGLPIPETNSECKPLNRKMSVGR